MHFPILVTPEAEDDLRHAIHWHEQVRDGLGSQFEEQFETTLNYIQANPAIHRIIYRKARRRLMLPFKYNIYYVVFKEHISIVALIHSSRHSRVWKKRLR